MIDLYIFAVFSAGLLMFLSPCVFPLLPVYFGVLEKDNKKIRNTILFLLGLSTAFVTLGFSFGIIGEFLYTPAVRKVGAVIIVIMGIQQLGILNFNFLNKTKVLRLNIRYSSSAIESFMLGFTFSLGWTPCIGPILGSVLLTAGESGSALYGAFLLAIFVLGFIAPFVIFTIFYEKLTSKIMFIKKNMEIIKKMTAILIIVMGLLLYYDKIDYIISIFM